MVQSLFRHRFKAFTQPANRANEVFRAESIIAAKAETLTTMSAPNRLQFVAGFLHEAPIASPEQFVIG
jgi:hypothetical protein